MNQQNLNYKGEAIPPPLRKMPEPHATGLAFCALQLSFLFTVLTLGGGTPSAIGKQAAFGTGLGLILYALFDLSKGIWNLLRLDNVAFFALYVLLFIEFWFPQEAFNQFRTVEDTLPGVKLSIFAMSLFAIGNQIKIAAPVRLMQHITRPISPRDLWVLFVIALFLAYFYKLLSVNFNPIAMIEAFFNNRWARPWARGKFGGWSALLSELSMFSYLIPPLAGVLISKARLYSRFQMAVVWSGLSLVLLDGFCGGTRNVLAAFVISMVLAWSYFQFLARRYVRILTVWALALGLSYLASNAMLTFRNMGLRNYLNQKDSFAQAMMEPSQEKSMFVDYNLSTLCELMTVFPASEPYLGWEIPYNGLIRPIPRALFPAKPKGLSVSIEEACGVSGMTLSCTYIGEAYMSAGWVGVAVFSLLLGMFARWGTQFISLGHTDYGIMVFASLAFAFAVCMRSFMSFSTMLLPAVALFVYAKIRARDATKAPSGFS